MQRPKFITGKIYHALNRGVEKRTIFLDDEDRFRFIHNLFEFNDTAPALNIYYKRSQLQSYEVGLRKIEKPRELVVEILAFCLMPNHFHLLLRERIENGITMFMRKLGTGYTNYFNQKYKRVGSLFQGKFKSVQVESDAHFVHLPYYIHLNPLDLIAPEWRNKTIVNYKKTVEYLNSYRWSSYLDYTGKKNFPSLTQREFLLEFFNGPKQYQKSTEDWLKQLDLGSIDHLLLE